MLHGEVSRTVPLKTLFTLFPNRRLTCSVENNVNFSGNISATQISMHIFAHSDLTRSNAGYSIIQLSERGQYEVNSD